MLYWFLYSLLELFSYAMLLKAVFHFHLIYSHTLSRSVPINPSKGYLYFLV